MRLTDTFLPKRTAKIPLKRSMTGYETEMFVLDSNGRLCDADMLLKKAKNLPVQKECSRYMVEVACLPARRLSTSSRYLIDNLTELGEIAQAQGNALYPFGTYFGTNAPLLRRKNWYTVQKKILGETNFINAGKCCGFHQHYTLPRGIYDKKNKFITYRKNSKINKSLIDSYNFLNAADPVFTTLTQSSPFVDTARVAKDARLVLYRGGKTLRNSSAVYAKQPIFGGLSPYKSTIRDLMSTLRRRHQKWKRLMIEHKADHSRYINSTNILNFTWNPVKINPKGTLEYRGSDMNFLSTLFGMSTMLKFSLRAIQQDNLIVTPADIGPEDAFRVEGNMVFIPPFATVNLQLQRDAAYEGLRNDDVYTYVKRCYRFVKEIAHDDYAPFLKNVRNMLDERKTRSDSIISYFKKRGYDNEIPTAVAEEAALHFSEAFMQDLKQLSWIQ